MFSYIRCRVEKFYLIYVYWIELNYALCLMLMGLLIKLIKTVLSCVNQIFLKYVWYVSVYQKNVRKLYINH